MARNQKPADAPETEDEGLAPPGGEQFEQAGEGLVVDLSKVEAMSFDTLAAGYYNLMISACTAGKSKSSGQPMWSYETTVLDEGDTQGRKIFGQFSFSEKALPGTKAALVVVAPEFAETKFNPMDDELARTLIGRKFKCKVKVQKGSDGYDDRNSISKWGPVDEQYAFS